MPQFLEKQVSVPIIKKQITVGTLLVASAVILVAGAIVYKSYKG